MKHTNDVNDVEEGQNVNTLSEIEEYYKAREQQLLEKLHQQEAALAAAEQTLKQLTENQKALMNETTEQRAARERAFKFEVMKTHSMFGAGMLHDLNEFAEQPLLQTAYEIARWHHERWDGRGYPDGLKGDEIPISAQLVSLADVYDALTSERCYKKAFSHEKAVQMILNGECGAFNPLLLQCLTDIQADLKEKLQQHN